MESKSHKIDLDDEFKPVIVTNTKKQSTPKGASPSKQNITNNNNNSPIQSRKNNNTTDCMESEVVMEPKESSKTDIFLTFKAIKAFVQDLWSVFGGNQTTPLALYRRLLMKADEDDNDTVACINNFSQGFKVFLSNYEVNLESAEEFIKIPKGTVIRYKGNSERVFIEIQKFIFKSKADEKEIIRQHLLTIAATIDPNEKTLEALGSSPILEKFGMKDNSKEGQFVSNIMTKARKSMENVDTEDPTVAIMNLLGSGIVGEMVSGLKDGVEGGTMDMQNLLKSMTGALNTVMEENQANGGGDGRASNIDMDALVFNVQNSMKSKDDQ